MKKESPVSLGTLYTTDELATHLRVETRTIQRWIRQGKLSALRVGRRQLVSEEALSKFRKDHANPREAK